MKRQCVKGWLSLLGWGWRGSVAVRPWERAKGRFWSGIRGLVTVGLQRLGRFTSGVAPCAGRLGQSGGRLSLGIYGGIQGPGACRVGRNPTGRTFLRASLWRRCGVLRSPGGNKEWLLSGGGWYWRWSRAILKSRLSDLGARSAEASVRGPENQGVSRAALLDEGGAGRSNTRPPSGGQVAQLVEQRTENPRVGGSIPPLATIKTNTCVSGF